MYDEFVPLSVLQDELKRRASLSNRPIVEELFNKQRTMDETRQMYDKIVHLDEDTAKHYHRVLCRTDVYYLLRFICNRTDLEREWLFARCAEVQDASDGYLDLWAREHYKSTIITFGKTIQDILASHGDNPIYDREYTVGIFSHTRPIAKGFLRQIKNEFEGNDFLKSLFPDVLYQNPRKEAPKWSEDDGIIVKRKGNPKEATVEAWGLVDGQPTSKHFYLCIYDDVVTVSSVTTPDMINKTTEALALSYNLGTDGGKRRFIGTRYHYNDTYRTVLARQTAIVRLYPGTDDGTETGKPVLVSLERIVEMRRDMGPYTFACQILQNPAADNTQGFKEEWLTYYDKVNRAGMNVYLLFDPANGKKKENDYTCGWVVGLGPDGNIYVLGIVRDRLNLIERANLVFAWHRQWQPIRNGVRYERYGKDSDIQHMTDKMVSETYRFEIIEVGGSTPKNDRIKRLIPYFEQRRIIMPRTLYYTNYEGKTRDLIHDFIHEEYKAFPVAFHDDMLDALGRLFEPDLPLIWPKPKPIEIVGSTQSFSTPNSWMG